MHSETLLTRIRLRFEIKCRFANHIRFRKHEIYMQSIRLRLGLWLLLEICIGLWLLVGFRVEDIEDYGFVWSESSAGITQFPQRPKKNLSLRFHYKLISITQKNIMFLKCTEHLRFETWVKSHGFQYFKAY